ncbi:hypothetical protein V6N12_034637 [Hibiscus sabdariffa]|uniref:GRF-type domain-containing protein n=1 Tax=Hibiscus sabdariffa TaxID=183260 RepID=A0ABR2DHR4_9ROSI
MEVGIPICRCGLEAKVVVSWTDDNPGRRFYGCKNYGRESHFRLFTWYDAPLTPRARVVIVGLLRKVKKMERAKKIERICWLCLLDFLHGNSVGYEVIDWVGFISIEFYCMGLFWE